MEYPSETWLWASQECETAIQEAKQYIIDEGYSSDTVRLVRNNGQIIVVKK